jgi:hypothetical protein
MAASDRQERSYPTKSQGRALVTGPQHAATWKQSSSAAAQAAQQPAEGAQPGHRAVEQGWEEWWVGRAAPWGRRAPA